MKQVSLNDLIKEHPEWADLPIAVYSGGNGDYDYLGDRADAYRHTSTDEDVKDGAEPIDVLVISID